MNFVDIIKIELERFGFIKKHDSFDKIRRMNQILNKKEFYMSSNSKSTFEHPWLVERCSYISESGKYVYCRFPKAANSTVIATLYHAEYGIENVSRDEMNQIKTESGIKLGSLSKSQIEEIRNDYIKFVIARHPVSRIRSSYIDKIYQPITMKHRRHIARFNKKSLLHVPTFSEFLDYLEFGNGLSADAHWAQQVDLMAFSVDELDIVGKVENINNDLILITTAVYGEPKPVKTWDIHASGKKTDDVILSNTEINRIYHMYEQDFDTFHYSKSK